MQPSQGPSLADPRSLLRLTCPSLNHGVGAVAVRNTYRGSTHAACAHDLRHDLPPPLPTLGCFSRHDTVRRSAVGPGPPEPMARTGTAEPWAGMPPASATYTEKRHETAKPQFGSRKLHASGASKQRLEAGTGPGGRLFSRHLQSKATES